MKSVLWNGDVMLVSFARSIQRAVSASWLLALCSVSLRWAHDVIVFVPDSSLFTPFFQVGATDGAEITVAGLTSKLVASTFHPNKGDEFGSNAITAVETLAEASFSHGLVILRFEVILFFGRLAQFSRVQWIHALETELVTTSVDAMPNTGCTNVIVSELLSTIRTLGIDIHLCSHAKVVSGYEVRTIQHIDHLREFE